MTTEKISSRTGTVWIDQELQIMRFEYALGSVCTLVEAKENMEIQRKLLAGRRMPILIDVQNAKSIDREARMFYAGVEDFSATALLGGTPIGNMIGNFFIAVYGRRNIPTKLFTKEADAIAWLKGLPR
jgi:hypothetical protein